MLIAKNIVDINSHEFKLIDALYETSFPWHEKREQHVKPDVFKQKEYTLQAFFDNTNLVGFIAFWTFEQYIYIEHLAVNDKVRGMGYGTKILKQFLSNHDVVILEIDPLTTEIAKKRLCFYQKLGFILNDFTHYHPAYHINTPDHHLLVLSYPQQIDNSIFREFSDDLQHLIMKDASNTI